MSWSKVSIALNFDQLSLLTVTYISLIMTKMTFHSSTSKVIILGASQLVPTFRTVDIAGFELD